MGTDSYGMELSPRAPLERGREADAARRLQRARIELQQAEAAWQAAARATDLAERALNGEEKTT